MSGVRAEHFNVIDWLEMVKDGLAQMPDFQRDFVWKFDKTEKFLNAILEERPVGFLLLLKVDSAGDAPFNPRTIEGAAPSTDKPIKYLILDGQQRITSLWTALMDQCPSGRKFFVSYSNDDVPNGQVKSMHARKWHEQPRTCLQNGFVPISLLRHTRSHNDLEIVQDWVDEALIHECGNVNAKEQRKLVGWIGDYGERLRTFEIPHLMMAEDTEPSKAIETFIEANTTSVNLKKFDIATAQNLASDGNHNLRKTRDIAFESIDGLKKFIDAPSAGDLILKIACLRTGHLPVESKFRDKTVLADVSCNYTEIIEGIRWVVELLNEDSIWDRRRLPSIVPLRVLPPLHGYYLKNPRQQGNIRKTVRAYFWRAFLTDRYRSSAATLLKDDYDGLKCVIANNQNPKKLKVPIWELRPPNLNEIQKAAWPTKTTLGKAILAISLRRGASDISSGEKLRPNNAPGREYHHLFPDSYLRKYAPNVNRHAAVNCILINGKTNRAAADKPPLDYLQNLAVRASGSQIELSDLKSRLDTHLVPMEYLEIENQGVAKAYRVFTKKRAQLIQNDIELLFEGNEP